MAGEVGGAEVEVGVEFAFEEGGAAFGVAYVFGGVAAGAELDSDGATLEGGLEVLNARAMELLDAVDLAGQARATTVELSYGRKRALELATTLALEPELMLLDEPTQGMGREDVGRVVSLIRKLSAGRTVLMVEHNLSVVADLSDTITVLARGSVLAEGGYAEVSRDPAVLEAYIGAEP